MERFTRFLPCLLICLCFSTGVLAQRGNAINTVPRVMAGDSVWFTDDPPEITAWPKFLGEWVKPKRYYKLSDYQDPVIKAQLIDLLGYASEVTNLYEEPQEYLDLKNLEYWAGSVNWDFTLPAFRKREGEPEYRLNLWAPHPEHTLRYATSDPVVHNYLLEPILRPLRNTLDYGRRALGIRAYAYAYYTGWSVSDILPTQTQRSGTAGGVGASISWIPYEIKNHGIGRITSDFYKAFELPSGVVEPGELAGSNILLNNNPDGSVFSFSQLFFSQELFQGRIRVDAGKLNTYNYYAYNWFAGDETYYFLASPFVGGNVWPNGIRSGRPGVGIQYFWNKHDIYMSATATSPLANRLKLDFSTLGDGQIAAAFEIGKMIKPRGEDNPNINGRLSAGVHYGTAGPNTTNLATKTPGYGFNVMWQQALTSAHDIPYIAGYTSFFWSERQLANVQAQYNIGFTVDKIFGRRDDGIGLAFAVNWPSSIYRPNWRVEKNIDMFYRLWFTEDISIGPHYTLSIDPGNPAQTKNVVHVFQFKALFYL